MNNDPIELIRKRRDKVKIYYAAWPSGASQEWQDIDFLLAWVDQARPVVDKAVMGAGAKAAGELGACGPGFLIECAISK